MPRGTPEAIRAWFYPGNRVGEEFVYPKPRALMLAKAAKTVVPAITVEASDVDALKAAPIVAITPDEREMTVEAAIMTKPTESTATHTVPAADTSSASSSPTRHLPKTASALPLIGLLGLGSIGVALGLMLFGKRSVAQTR
jgi:hypothetical protein